MDDRRSFTELRRPTAGACDIALAMVEVASIARTMCSYTAQSTSTTASVTVQLSQVLPTVVRGATACVANSVTPHMGSITQMT